MRSIKIITGVTSACLLLFASTVKAQLGALSGPIFGYHGNPSNCSSCHTGNGYTGSASFSVPATVPHSTQTTGQAFDFVVSTNAPGWGFNIAIYDPSATKLTRSVYTNLSAHINDGVTGVNAGNHGDELQHYSRQTATSDPSFDFIAPSTLGTYTIYGCLNQVDGDDVGFDADDGPPECTSTTFTVINNPPNAENDTTATGTSITVGEDSGLSAQFDVFGNDLPLTEGDSYSWFATNTTGLIGLLNDNMDGTYRYNPNGQFESLAEGESTTTSFTYIIEEDGYGAMDCQGSPCRDTATVTIQIDGANDRPTAVNDGSLVSPFVTVQEGMSIDNGTDGDGTNNDLASNDTDPDATDNLDATRTGCPGGVTGPSNGTITFFGADGTFTYTHDGSNTTSDSFTYCTFDDSATGTSLSLNSATVFIEITPVNDSPTISTSAGNTAFTEQTPVIVDSNLTLGDSDSTQFDGATVQITGNFQAGDSLACALPLPGGIASCNFTGSTLTLAGTSNIADYESALENVTYTSSSDNPDLGARTITFIVEDDLGAFSLPGANKNIDPINRVNDPLTLGPANLDTSGTEGQLVTVDVGTVFGDPDNSNDGVQITWSFVSGFIAGMNLSNTGVLTWTPPLGTPPPPANTTIYTVEVRAFDGEFADTKSFDLTIDPPDGDGDGIADYNDYCPTIGGTNGDNDGDGTFGMDADPNDTIGGDDCDSDDDNDGMPDTYETANGFDPFDNADAGQDADGDGISNLQEFLDGTNPNFANLVIDATGYLTPFTLPKPDPTMFHPQATSASPSDPGPYRPGRHTITWIASNSTNANLAQSDQTLDVRPLLNFAANQVIDEGTAATVEVMLNGDSPTYPVTVNYSISGTATQSADYTPPAPASGVLQFTDSMPRTISFNTTSDAVVDPDETVVFTLTGASNAALGSRRTHRVTLSEENVAPVVDLRIDQGGSAIVYDDAVPIDFAALATDSSPVAYDWTGTDNALMPVPVGNNPNWTIAPPFIAGNYVIELLVTDTGTPPRSTRVRRILKINPGPAPGGDLSDADNDGVPADFDNHDGSANPVNLHLMADQTANPATSRTIQTDPGNQITTGNTAKGANRNGPMVTRSDIANFGSVTGGPPTNPDDSYRHVSGIIDFEVHRLVPGSSARVVIPLNAGIPRNATYRKFNPAIGWGDFVLDSGNALASAPGALGACPEPGSSAYRSGLNYLDKCLQLTIRDGGPNDTDNLTNGVIADPGAIGVRLTDPVIEEVEEGSGRISSLLLMLLAVLGLLGAWRRRGRLIADNR